MGCERPDRGVWFDRQRQCLPALSAVFGALDGAGAAEGACGDVCDPQVIPATGGGTARLRAAVTATAGAGELDAAILNVVVSARPPVGRTRAVEILRGGRSKVVAQHAYDALAGYGAFGFNTYSPSCG